MRRLLLPFLALPWVVACPQQTSLNAVPTVVILAPADGAVFAEGSEVVLRARAADPEDGTTGLEIRWESDQDGLIAEQTSDAGGEVEWLVSSLRAGTHTITAEVEDSLGLRASDARVLTIDAAPSAPVVSIDPSPAGDDADLRLQFDELSVDPEGATLSYRIEWLRDGSPLPGFSGAETIPAADTELGETWSVEVRADDGVGLSDAGRAETTIAGGRPTTDPPTVTPMELYTDDTATCTAGAVSDPDGDPVTLAFSWLVDDLDPGVEGPTLGGEWFSRGQEVACVVTPSDPTGPGGPAVSAPVLVLNSAPTAAELAIAPAAPLAGVDDLTCLLETPATDADEDGLSYAFSWTVDGAPYLGAATTTWPGDTVPASATAGGQTWVCTAVASDHELEGPPASASVVLNGLPTTAPPTITPTPLFTDDTATCTPGPSHDPDGDDIVVELHWLVDGAPTGVTGSTLEGTWFSRGQDVVCVATPTTAEGAGEPAPSAPVTVSNSPPEAPLVQISPASPVAGVDDLFCEVVGEAYDPDLDEVSYEVVWSWPDTVPDPTLGTTDWPEDTAPGTSTAEGQVWSCEVTAWDDIGPGGSALETVLIGAAPAEGKLVFATSTRYDGNLGGLTGADRRCQERADAVGLPGTYRAWLSDASSGPSTRFARSTTAPYVRLDGVVVADDWADLTDGAIQNPINITELGTETDYSFVWSFTRVDGSPGLFGDRHEDCYGIDCHCSGWSHTISTGPPYPGSAVAIPRVTDDDWTDYSFGNFCGSDYGLYCFEQ